MKKLGVTFSADYAFMGSKEAEEDMQPSLIMYDDSKGAFRAAGVRAKGVTEAVVTGEVHEGHPRPVRL